ncbi:hypothetical protein KKHFBJBL_00167 [Brevundimonas sp. NIBR11]|nr:hypothetical protein KKHFBJBL_00167 [Brevundimonas sp. NIBR11]
MAFALVALAILLAPGLAQAQARGNAQADQTYDNPAPRGLPANGLYASEIGERFIFDGRGIRPLFRFERREETWVLRTTPAPRGDVIFRNDAGAQILRVTPDGGLTLYTTRAPNGSPATRIGPAPALELPTLGPIRLFTLMNQRGSLVSQAVGRLIVINLDGDQSEALMVDALIVTTEAVIRMARTPTFRDRVAGLRSITLVEGPRSSVTFSRNGDLRVVVDPRQGQAGRPSSSSIIRAVAPRE